MLLLPSPFPFDLVKIHVGLKPPEGAFRLSTKDHSLDLERFVVPSRDRKQPRHSFFGWPAVKRYFEQVEFESMSGGIQESGQEVLVVVLLVFEPFELLPSRHILEGRERLRGNRSDISGIRDRERSDLRVEFGEDFIPPIERVEIEGKVNETWQVSRRKELLVVREFAAAILDAREPQLAEGWEGEGRRES
jgi:hypothetical protein